MNLLRGNKGKRKREKEECPVLQIVVVSQIGWSEVAREMAPESYELLMPGLSDSWLPGLWARDASIWASDTWMDKTMKICDEALTEKPTWTHRLGQSRSAMQCNSYYNKKKVSLPLQTSWLCTARPLSRSSVRLCHREPYPADTVKKV